jgi:hypothetical protein
VVIARQEGPLLGSRHELCDESLSPPGARRLEWLILVQQDQIFAGPLWSVPGAEGSQL